MGVGTLRYHRNQRLAAVTAQEQANAVAALQALAAAAVEQPKPAEAEPTAEPDKPRRLLTRKTTVEATPESVA